MYVEYILMLSFQLQVMVRSHFYLKNPFGVVLKTQGPMLELSQGKNSQILIDNKNYQDVCIVHCSI